MLTLLDKVQRHRRPQTQADFPAHHALAQQLAAESIVLLKNDDNLLPLRAECTRRIAVLGKPGAGAGDSRIGLRDHGTPGCWIAAR